MKAFAGDFILIEKYAQVWDLALPYLEAGKKKDFVLHTKCVIKSMQMLLENEKGDADILMPAAILHDTGWSKVPAALQKSLDKAEAKKAMQMHLECGALIAEELLAKLNYGKDKIKRIAAIVFAHKFQSPQDSEKQIMIDADNLTDVFYEQFYGDCKDYKLTPEELFNIRKNNTYYTKTARKIFASELDARKKEIWN
ncbi:MAG: HD domain-containing protein [Nanoarchaeota archaeon]|nr:HD domain-containing protein [Nanoarchaeota archaeon]MBU4451882.1 HD domain-containing protein [Nanoarchaeota archaeon]MCG2724165.1 HD domain-containing protein [archaeon]